MSRTGCYEKENGSEGVVYRLADGGVVYLHPGGRHHIFNPPQGIDGVPPVQARNGLTILSDAIENVSSEVIARYRSR